MSNFLRISLILILTLSVSSPALATEFIAISGPLPPYTICKGMRAEGITIEILTRIMQQTDTPFNPKNIKILPWKAAHNQALKISNRILCNVPRTAKIENNFKWVGPFAVGRFSLIGKKHKAITIKSISDIQSFTVATIRDSGPEKTLKKRGMNLSQFKRNSTHVQALRGLESGEIDLFAHQELSTAYLMSSLGMSPQQYTVVHTFKEVPMYFAFHKQTNEKLIARLNAALKQILETSPGQPSEYDTILQRYLPQGKIQ